MSVLKGLRLNGYWKGFKHLFNIEKCWLQYYLSRFEIDWMELDMTLDYYENKDLVDYRFNF